MTAIEESILSQIALFGSWTWNIKVVLEEVLRICLRSETMTGSPAAMDQECRYRIFTKWRLY